MRGDLNILHQDDAILVLVKPSGLLAVPGRRHQDNLVDRARRLFPTMIRQPAVHRLDQQTSGLMVLAQDRDSHRLLSRQFEHRQVVKRYLAIVEGRPEGGSGTITLPFRLDPDNRPFQVYDPVHGREAVTHWRLLGVEGAGARIEFTPLTGRTHQLRVHSAHPLGLGAPIVGDRLYGSGKEGDAMLLHASYLSFTHPAGGRIVEFFSAPPF